MFTKQSQLYFFGIILTTLLLFTACQREPKNLVPRVEVVAEGLINPVGLAALPDGSLFIAEMGTGQNDLSAGVSLRTPDGEIGRFISGLPSTLDSGDLSGVPLVGVSLDERTLYIGNYGEGHLWTYPLEPRRNLPLPNEAHMPDELGTAVTPLNNVKLTNPYDIAFDEDGVPVVSDATGNGVAKETRDGATRFLHRFAPLPDTSNDKLTIDPVPTGITRVGDEYYVTLLGGCPYPPGSGVLVAIDEVRNERTVLTGLNMAIDVAVDEDGMVWVLEFATFTPGGDCFSGADYQQNTGVLSRIAEDGTLETVVEHLNHPGAVQPMPDGSLYVTEVYSGRLLHITFVEEGENGTQMNADERRFEIEVGDASYREIEDADAALTAVINRLNLQPNPGEELREGDTPLAKLGQDLFFDPILSGDLNASCATCHHPALAMADARVLPIGTGGAELGPMRDFVEQVTLGPDASQPRRQAGTVNEMSGEVTVINPFKGNFVPRNSPTVLNAALLSVQFWDGRVQSAALGETVTTQEGMVNTFGMTDAMDVQALFPLTSLHEMSGATLGDLAPQDIRNHLIARLMEMPVYQERFEALFGTEQITAVQLATAIGAFERRFVFTDAPWDDYVAGDADALTEQQKRGALLFFGDLNTDVNCAQCHNGDLFTDLSYHNLLVPQLGPGKGFGDNGREDWGRSLISYDRRDQYAFRTPSLRNAALTAPYFHTGAYATLEATIWHHANMWQSAANYDPSAHLPPAYYSSVRAFEPDKQGHSAAPQLRDGLPLSEQDVADLVAFIHALTDPAAEDLSEFTPESVPSGLPMDPPPDLEQVRQALARGGEITVNNQQETVNEKPFGWGFVDATEEVGLDFEYGSFATATFDDPAAMMGGGLCWIDYDNDGWLDLYITNSHAEEEIDYWAEQGGLPENGLFKNENGSFANVSQSTQTNLAGRFTGCVTADFNMDGWYDLFVTADGPNALLMNNGDGTFTEGAAAAGLDTPEWNSRAIVADLNLDGWPDLFVGSFIDLEREVPRPTGAFPGDYYGLPDYLYMNNGVNADGRVTFRDVASIVGLAPDERALGAVFSDFDMDGDLDLYIANDGQANRLYVYEPMADDPENIGFRFVDRTQETEVGDTGSGMGVNSADYDGDGFFDLFVTNWEAELNAIYRNETAVEGHLNFRYSTYRIGMRGLGNDMTGWGVLWADFDHDGDVDLLTANGRVPVTNWETDPELARLYGNRLVEGHPGEYREWTQLVGLKEVGPLIARGAAAADFDNDGDLDVAINRIGGTAVILRNDGGNENGNWLEISFDGFYPGTLVTVTLPDGTQLLREWHAGSSYHSSEDPRLHFGLGDVEIVDVEVRWPDGSVSQMEGVSVNQLVVTGREG